MERRDEIAECAIRLIAVSGIRALTHRAIDRDLGLPAGSTSYYFRTRHQLLAAIVDRLTARSRDEFAALDTSDVAASVVHYVRQLTVERRHHVVARAAMTVECGDDPDLRRRLANCLFSTPEAQSLLGTSDGAGLVALLEGLVYERAVNGRDYDVEPIIERYLR
ncbi:TetR/AcrR family transcriptional regulator [Actinomycetes bacterium M1A6_2h]